MPEFTGTNDVRSYFAVLWRWKYLFLAVVVIVPVIAYLIERGSAKTYSSSALVGVNQTTVDTSLLNNGGSFSTTNVTAIAQLVTTSSVADVAAGLMKPPAQPEQIVGEVTAKGDSTTNFITITAEDRSATRAAAIANAFARAITLNQQKAAITQLRSAAKGLKAQLQHPSDAATRTQLQQQLSQLQAARFTQGGDAAILQPAAVAAAPTGLNTRRTIEIGLLIGLLLAIGAVVAAENADRRLRTPNDLELVTDLPLLASVPPAAFREDSAADGEVGESFNMLRNSLTYFNIDRQLDSVMITSPGEKDGKTTVALRLATAGAASGLHVILVDADLRRRQVSYRSGVADRPGFTDVITGECPLEQALLQNEHGGDTPGRLNLLPAGRIPSNPSGVLSSPAAEHVLRQLESWSDLVIIDTPAALAVGDPLPLMPQVSGVIIVARMNRSTRAAIKRLQRIIDSAHGTALGVVATGVTTLAGADHYTAKYYAHNGNGNGSGGLVDRLRTK